LKVIGKRAGTGTATPALAGLSGASLLLFRRRK